MASSFSGNDFEQLARQYWSAWGDSMRTGASQPQATVPGWNEAMAWWSQLAKSPVAGAAVAPGVDDAIDRLNTQAHAWFGQMQQLAGQFAGQNPSASDVASAWQRMLGAAGANPFADMFKGMQGPGQHGVEQWMDQMGPLLQSMQRDGRSWLGMPAFGFAREHQERWQALARAQLDMQEKTNAYNALMGEAAQQAFKRFEEKLSERSAPGRQLESARALFDLWIDAAEDAYADIALSPRFRQAYGDFVNAQMRVRGAMQAEVEQYCGLLGMPTRTEIDAAHRKIVQLERELRRVRDVLNEREPKAAHAAQAAQADAKAPGKPAAKKATKPKGARP